jgi:hypothetical protein
LFDRPEHRLGEFVQLSPIQTQVEGFTDISIGEPKFDVILLIGHGDLKKRETEAVVGDHRADVTLIMVRRALAEPNAI